MASREETEVALCRVASKVLKKDESQVDPTKSFTQQGGSALTAVFFAAQCRHAGLLVDAADASNASQTLRELATRLYDATHPSQPDEGNAAATEQETTVASSPLQQRYVTAGLTQTLVWDVNGSVTHAKATELLDWLVAKHPILSASFETHENELHLRKGNGSSHREHSELVGYQSDEACQVRILELQQEVASSLTSSTPVLRALLFGDEAHIQKIALVSPTAALDARSWQIIGQDMASYGGSPDAQTGTAQRQARIFEWLVKNHEGQQDERRNIPAAKTQREKKLLDDFSVSKDVPLSFLACSNVETFTLTPELTQLLLDQSCHSVFRTEVPDLILTSLAAAYHNEQSGVTRYVEIRDGRAYQNDANDGTWSTALGCFDELFEIPYRVAVENNVKDSCRRAKDARRQHHSMYDNTEDHASGRANLVLDLTALRETSSRSLVSRQAVGELIVHALGGLYVLPFWDDSQLSFNFICAETSGSNPDIRTCWSSFLLCLTELMASLSASSSRFLPTLTDCPHLTLDYAALDRLYLDKLQRIVKDPLSDIESVCPCSPIQNNILVANSLDAGAYMCTFKTRVSASGHLVARDAASWANAWNAVVEKHSALRTVFFESDARPGHFDQVVLKSIVPRIDIREASFPDADSFCPLDIEFQAAEVPHHLTIIPEGSDQFLIILTISHAITDGHSAEVIFDDMCHRVAVGHDDNSQETILPYTDFVIHQHPPLSSTAPKRDTFWQDYLQRSEETHLSVTRETGKLTAFKTTKSAIPINVRAVDRLCRDRGISLASLCQFAWGVVLRTYTGTDNVCFSTIAAVRHAPLKGIMTAVGPFVTTLLCSMNLQGDASVLDAVKAVHADYQETLTHEAESSAAVSTRRWSNTVMSFRRRLVQDDENLSDVSCKVIQGLSPTNYDVSLIVSAGQADMEASLDYWASRLDREHAQSLLESFAKALESTVQNLAGTVADLNIIPDAQEQRILERNLSVPKGVDRCVHELVEDRIQTVDPLKEAVEAWDGTLTYYELSQKATILSNRLILLGSGTEVPIGLCMHKSKFVPVAMLAILRSGGAVLPIGITEPLARVKVILGTAEPAIILCDEEQQERLQALGTPLLNVQHELTTQMPAPPLECPPARPQPHNLAWIFFTSGSTGAPKGALLDHNALATSLRAHGQAMGWSENTRALQFSAHTFDASVMEIFTTLVHGGCVCIPSDEERVNDLEGSIRRLKVNTMGLTSSVAAIISPQRVPLVKKLMLFGEAVKKSVVAAWYKHASVYNTYGPVETSIVVTAANPIRDLDDYSNIGHPLNVNIWVTDPRNPGRMLPFGAPGEMLVEGPLLARGYIHDQEKTSAAFIRDPEFTTRLLGPNPGRRFYRTGDVVRQNHDLSFSFVGRRDKQVKIRGQRLEVAEVEHWVVKSCQDVNRAVVGLLPRLEDDRGSLPGADGESGGDVLFAAVEMLPANAGGRLFSENTGTGDVLPSNESLRETLGRLRDTLHEQLPFYMIPTFYIPFGRIPLTSNLKTDLQLILPLISKLSRSDLQGYLPDETTVSEDDCGGILASTTARELNSLWVEVLRRDSDTLFRLGDHFLHQGGDSVTAIRLVEAARRKGTLTHITVADILSCPLLGDLVKVLEERQLGLNGHEASQANHDKPHHDAVQPFSLWTSSTQGSEDADLADIAAKCSLDIADIEDVYPCTPLQQAMVTATQQRSSAYFVQLVYALSEAVDIEHFRQSWNVLCETTPLLRTRILLGQRTATSLQVLSRTSPEWLQHDNLDEYAQRDRALPMTAGQPLVRFALVHEKSTSGKLFFVWTTHHSVYDGWSARLIFSQLADIYLHNVKPSVVPFTRFLKHLDSVRGRAAAFWKKQLEGDAASTFPHLPSSNYQPRPLSAYNTAFEPSLAASDSNTSGVSLANVLRAAWAISLGQYLASRQVMFGMTLSGRNAPVADITNLIAPTISTVPVRINLDPEMTVSRFLESVQSQAVEMIPFEHTGLEDIKQLLPDLQQAIDLRHNLIIQPAAMGSSGDLEISIPGVSLEKTVLDAFHTFALSVQCQLPPNDNVTEQVSIEAHFDDRVVSESQLEVLLQQFQNWTSILLDPSNSSSKLSAIDGVTETDLTLIKQQNLIPPQPMEQFPHHLVRSMVSEQPDASAICSWDGNFTYAEMYTHARTLATYLVGLGVGPDMSVAICMDKSRWVPVAMLAVLEAGAVLVFLGVQESEARHSALLKDCGARVLLSDDCHKARFSKLDLRTVAVNDELLTSLGACSVDGEICPALQLDHPAWIVYSSGSTGVPKGSLHLHCRLATSLVAHGKATRWSKQNRTLQFAAHTFDVMIQEILSTLIFGGCVCIPSEEERMNSIAQTINRLEVTHLMLTFSVAGIIDPTEVPSVKQLLVLGEQAKLGVVERWLGHAEILNDYGPSECATCVSVSAPMRKVEDAHNIGVPFEQCNFWIANPTDYHLLCPVGVPGELLIESAWQAREYVNLPERTAKAFVAEPAFVHQLGLGRTGRRFYRTGDLVRQNPDGSYTYLGRIDSQVKFRGQRLELDEIEYCITKELGRASAVVVDLVDFQAGQGPGDLVAVIELNPADDTLFDLNETRTELVEGVEVLAPSIKLQRTLCHLKDALAEKLPSHMVPTAYLPWCSIPITASGKTDRIAVRRFLTNLSLGQSLLKRYLALEASKESPSTETGKRLRQLWANVLSIDADSIGARDHFTRLGGDSLAAMKLASLGQQNQLPLTVALIFTHPVLDDLALALDQSPGEDGSSAAARNDPAPFELVPKSEESRSTSTGPSPDDTRDWPDRPWLEDLAIQCGVAAEDVEDAYPCTPMQEALFAITARQPSAYKLRQIFRAKRDMVDLPRFQNAWHIVSQKLPILRTRVVLDRAGSFLQAVVRTPLQWRETHDLNEYLEADNNQGFEVGQPLLRFAIARRQDSGDADEWYFVLTSHHSMFDRFSIEKIFLDYISPTYAELEMATVVPYTRFIRYISEGNMTDAAQYWNRTLAEGEAFTDFPSLPFRGYELRHESKAAKLLSHTVSVDDRVALHTPFPNLLRAAWALTVSQYAAVQDVMFAVNLSGRSAPIPGIADVAAPTFTTVPVRIKVDREQKVHDFLDTIQRDAVEMIPHEHVGLQKIGELVPTFSSAALRHLFLVHPAVDRDISSHLVPGLEHVDADQEGQAEEIDYPLEIMCIVDERRNTHATVEARFDSSAITSDRLKLILRQFEHNVKQLGAATGDLTIRDLSLANPDDLKQISDWNLSKPFDTPLARCCVHHLVRDNVQNQPHDLAVDSWDGQLTYQQLDTMARRLAHTLTSDYLVRPEVAVGFCMERSRWAIVSILAILYAGGAVVPLGVQQPLDRIDTIVQDCSPAVVLCDEDQVTRLGNALAAKTLLVNEATMVLLQQHQGDLQLDSLPDLARPENMAWIIYTSGSTGTPKGVVLEHASLSTSVQGHSYVQQIGPGFRAFHFSAYTWDVSITDVFAPLHFGGTICVPSETERMNDLVGAIQRLDVNLVDLTPSAAALIPPREVPQVKMLMLGGEPMIPSLLENWLQHSDAVVINGYGPTECSITTTSNVGVKSKDDVSVIGKPLPGTRTQLWILSTDDANCLAPVGAVGELAVSGPILARGYLNDPSKTTSSFISNPRFLADIAADASNPMLQQAQRVYRTGDLVQYNPDGSLSVLGRDDSQVKIRGQRVDLAEIEYFITKIAPAISMAVVDYVSLKADQKTLVAVLECDPAQHNDFSEITTLLKTSLPDKIPPYMVPRVFMPMEKIPGTASAKVDRKAVRRSILAELSRKSTNGDSAIQDALHLRFKATGTVHNDQEALVRKLWAVILGVEADSIDRQDNFLDLGADSISAMKLVALAKLEGLEMKVLDVFKNPTLAMLATATESQQGTNNSEQAGSQKTYQRFELLKDSRDAADFLERVICPVANTGPEGIEDVFPTTDGVALNAIGALTSSQVEVYTFALDASGVNLDRLHQSCLLLLQHVEAFRTGFVLHQRQLLQVVLKEYPNEIEVVQTTSSIKAATKTLLDNGFERRFQLGRPMARLAIVFQPASEQARVLIRISHALYDGLSLPTLYDTLRDIYDRQSAPLKELYPYAAHVHDLTSHVTGQTYEYWQNLLQGCAMAELSPARKSFDPSPSPVDFVEAKRIPVSLMKGEGITTSMVIACAWGHVLAQYTGSQDVVFGDSISGINLVDSSASAAVVGCRATHLPVRLKFGQGYQQTLLELLRQFRDQQRDRIPHEALGFRSIIRDCTDWAPSTRFTSIVNHRPAESSGTPNGGGLDFQVSILNAKGKELSTWYDIAVLSEESDGCVELVMAYSIEAFECKTAQVLFEALVNTVSVIMSPDADWSQQPALSASGNLFEDLHPPAPYCTSSTTNGQKQNGALKDGLASVVEPSPWLEAAWSSTFDASKRAAVSEVAVDRPTSQHHREAPFYEQGGDLVDAACLANLVDSRRKEAAEHMTNGSSEANLRAQVTVDDVLQHPSLLEFARFLRDESIRLDAFGPH